MTITYRELRELSYMGATVLHEDAIFPVRKEGIPINIRNTNAPEDKGTLIVESHLPEAPVYHHRDRRQEGILLAVNSGEGHDEFGSGLLPQSAAGV